MLTVSWSRPDVLSKCLMFIADWPSLVRCNKIYYDMIMQLSGSELVSVYTRHTVRAVLCKYRSGRH